jgi:hypothetical protein
MNEKMTLELWEKLRYFHPNEKYFGRSAWGDYLQMDASFMFRFDEYRHRLGRPIIPHHGYRLRGKNHPKGNTCDFHVVGMDLLDLYILAERMGFSGIGMYKWGMHLDTNHEVNARWVREKYTGDKDKDYKPFDSGWIDFVRGQYKHRIREV